MVSGTHILCWCDLPCRASSKLVTRHFCADSLLTLQVCWHFNTKVQRPLIRGLYWLEISGKTGRLHDCTNNLSICLFHTFHYDHLLVKCCIPGFMIVNVPFTLLNGCMKQWNYGLLTNSVQFKNFFQVAPRATWKNFSLSAQLSGRARTVGPCHEALSQR